MTLQERMTLLVQTIGADVKTLLANQGSLSALSTTAKGSLVAAINEVQAIAGTGTGGGAAINDTAGDGVTTETWSANKIFDSIAQLRIDILGGASPAYDTLLELQVELEGQDSAVANILVALDNRVRFDVAQTLTAIQKAQGNANLGSASLVDIGNPDTDLVAVYTTAKA